MTDRDLEWVTDQTLQITSLSAQLRELLDLNSGWYPLHVSDLFSWGDPFAIAGISHNWALEGEPVAFDMHWQNQRYFVSLEPLRSPDGRVYGVRGRASAIVTESAQSVELPREHSARRLHAVS
ncbi:MAG: hypothetical protein M3Y21_02020 [Candidatus Eremiobacteraeota bacterium]|nr:hypothetical protein [Candidatus Eremiobacteraeota bacterium]